MEFFSSCGLKTPPENIPEKKSKSTIDNLNVIQKGEYIRISWELSEKERIKALERFYEYPHENEFERNKVFGSENLQYNLLKKRLPKIALDLICKWYEDNFENITEREEKLKKWFDDQFNNGKEKGNAFSRLDNNQILQDYFIIKEKNKPSNCRGCEGNLKEIKRVYFTSNLIKREGSNFYYYLKIPKKNFLNREFELTHHGPDNGILTPKKTFFFKESNFFPEVPNPKFKIVQIEDEKQTIKFPFGEMIINESTLASDLIEGNKEVPSFFQTKKSDNINGKDIIKIIIRIYWPKISDFGVERFSGSGNYFEKKKNFKVNLYRKRIGENWPEIPQNFKSSKKNYYLDKMELNLFSVKNKEKINLQNKNTSSRFPFYIDLQGENSDTWLYQIRLVDSLGNESLASETITINLPRKKINREPLIENNNSK